MITSYRALLRSALIHDQLERAGVPDVQAVWTPEAGGTRLFIAVAIKLQDGGPVLLGQERVGRGGCVFRAWKFRSMIPDAERHTGDLEQPASSVGHVERRLLERELILGLVSVDGAVAAMATSWVAASARNRSSASRRSSIDAAFRGAAGGVDRLARVRAAPRGILDLAARFEALLREVAAFEAQLRGGPPRSGAALARTVERYAALDLASQPYSYVFGYGEDEFAPWHLGATL